MFTIKIVGEMDLVGWIWLDGIMDSEIISITVGHCLRSEKAVTKLIRTLKKCKSSSIKCKLLRKNAINCRKNASHQPKNASNWKKTKKKRQKKKRKRPIILPVLCREILFLHLKETIRYDAHTFGPK